MTSGWKYVLCIWCVCKIKSIHHVRVILNCDSYRHRAAMKWMLLYVTIKAVMKNVLEESQREHLSVWRFLFPNNRMFASSEFRKCGVHVMMHIHGKSLRGVMIINEDSIKFMHWNMGLLFPYCVIMTERSFARCWHQRRLYGE